MLGEAKAKLEAARTLLVYGGEVEAENGREERRRGSQVRALKIQPRSLASHARSTSTYHEHASFGKFSPVLA